MKPETIRQYEDALYHKATDGLPRDRENSFDEEAAVKALAALIKVDPDRIREQRAAQIIKNRSRPDGTDAGGLLLLMGDAYAYEPDRLIRYGDARVVENRNAMLEAKAQAAERAQDNLDRVARWNRRVQNEARIFGVWSTKEALAGRDVLDLTWGNCVNETGLIKPAS